MFTSRAEHRLLLRQDNVERRLLKYGFELGLISKEQYDEMRNREVIITKGKDFLASTNILPSQINVLLEDKNIPVLDNSEPIDKLIKRPELTLKEVLNLIIANNQFYTEILCDEKIIEQLEIEIKYDGYIKRQEDLIAKMDKLERIAIPLNFNYANLNAISTEGREKLCRIKPRSIGQAARISGVTPSDISVLLVYLKS